MLGLATRITATGTVADISVPMLEVARAWLVPDGAATPDFRQIDARTGDLREGAFDAVFSRFGVARALRRSQDWRARCLRLGRGSRRMERAQRASRS